MWTQQTRVIIQRYPFMAYDIQGMGCTDNQPGAYSFDRHAEDLYLLVRHLGLTEFVLEGLSISGMTTMNYGLAHPECLKGIIIADPVSTTRRQMSWR
jgi:pimeloyl-ACP methyl ester carboxylesterase